MKVLAEIMDAHRVEDIRALQSGTFPAGRISSISASASMRHRRT